MEEKTQRAEFKDVRVHSGEAPDGEATEQSLATMTASSLVNTSEQARAVAEVIGEIAIAREIGRNDITVWSEVKRSCSRYEFAEKALYAYPRGGKTVEGITIRLAEEMARLYGHINAGMREISRTKSETKVEAFAWDKVTNTRISREFIMRFARDVGGGSQDVKTERDKYEVMANFGMRRVRACIEQLLPADLVAMASTQCKRTLAGNSKDPIQDRIRWMVLAFDDLNITLEHLEGYLGHPVEKIVEVKLAELRGVYNSIRDGIAKPDEFFDFTPTGNGKPAKGNGAPKPAKTAPESPAEKPGPERQPQAATEQEGQSDGSQGQEKPKAEAEPPAKAPKPAKEAPVCVNCGSEEELVDGEYCQSCLGGEPPDDEEDEPAAAEAAPEPAAEPKPEPEPAPATEGQQTLLDPPKDGKKRGTW